MPNISYSKLKFCNHDGKQFIDAIKEKLGSEESVFDFTKIIPLTDDSCTHASDRWGTKWNALDPIITVNSDWSLVYQFSTAWSIPLPILNEIFRLFPDTDIEFLAADDGGWFAYHIVKEKGVDAVINLWKSDESDPNGKVRAAMFEALNYSY